jgi:tRNA(Ile)-lysidine synthase
MRFIPAVSLVRFQSPPPIDDDYRRSGDSAFFYVREVPGRIMKRGPRNDIPFEYSIPRLKKEFETIGKSQGWWDIDSPIVLAVSGGSDSVAMLWMFAELWKGKLIIAHLEHGIRGSESRKDAIFVSEMAASFGLPLVSESRDVPGLLRKGESLEDGARRIRYKFLENTRASAGGWGIAVAHTSDDAAETFLHNLIRGSGVRGLTGIQEKRGFIFLPLLSFSRDFLRRMLNTYNIPWREDSTNTDTAYLRNRIRKSLLPFLESRFNPGVKEHILGTAADMTYYRQKEEMLQDSLFSAAERKVPFSSYSCGLDVIRKLGDAEMSVFFRGVGRKIGLRTLSRERTQSLVRLARSSGSWCFQWQREMFVFCSSPFVSWVDPDILNRLDHSQCPVPVCRKNLDNIATGTEFSLFGHEIVSLVIIIEKFLHKCPAIPLFPHRKRKDDFLVCFFFPKAVNTGDAGDDNNVTPFYQRLGGCKAKAFYPVVYRGILFDVCVCGRNIGLGLIVVIIAHKVVNGVPGKKTAKFTVKLGCEGFIVREDKSWPTCFGDDISHGKCFPASRCPEKCLETETRGDAGRELTDRFGLVT